MQGRYTLFGSVPKLASRSAAGVFTHIRRAFWKNGLVISAAYPLIAAIPLIRQPGVVLLTWPFGVVFAIIADP